MAAMINCQQLVLYLSITMMWSSGTVFAVIPIIGDYYPIEREALLQLKDSLSSPNLNSNWTGPPCMYNQSRWGGIACSNGHVVRIVLDGIQVITPTSLPYSFPQNISFLTKLSLRNNSIFGPLPNLTNLVYLEYVFLSRNLFTSSIPSHYAQLPNLKKIELQQNYLQGEIPPFDQPSLVAFNVSYNSLEGPIPRIFQGFPESCFEHNVGLCGHPLENQCPIPPFPNPSKKGSFRLRNIALIVASSVLVLFLVILVFLCYYKRVQSKETAQRNMATGDSSIQLAERKMSDGNGRAKYKDPEKTVELELFEKNIPVFDLDDLLRAPAEELGKGKLSTTYKATLESGLVVAVKRIQNANGLKDKEFIQQMRLLGKLRHQNLASIISFYNSKDEKLVVYEFVPNGSLFHLLHENRGCGRVALNWTTRLSIIKDVAKAMNFLHQHLPSHKVPHANLKSSNVLIHRQGQNYSAKVTDFGYYPLLSSRGSPERLLAIGRSPEFRHGKKLTSKVDVYCFGIILLEIITGRLPGDQVDDLSEWVRAVVNNDWSIDVLDVEIVGATEAHDEMLRLTELALNCTDEAPEKRPKMSQVLRRIQEIEQRSSDTIEEIISC